MNASAKPSWPALSPAWSWIQGTRVAKEPVTAPCTANTAATAYRARLTSPAGRLTSSIFTSLPRESPAVPSSALAQTIRDPA
ncbi:hypothetical protein GCM10017776_42560 [Streptomyces griseoluteus]|nr:hypothetical protein GCM10017776_42560 [Streptomyces griseoluteus]